MVDYTDKCGSCKYFVPIRKDGKLTRRGSCWFKTHIYHDASQKKCLRYENKGNEHGNEIIVSTKSWETEASNPDMEYIKECAESVGIVVTKETAWSISFMAEVMRRLREGAIE